MNIVGGVRKFYRRSIMLFNVKKQYSLFMSQADLIRKLTNQNKKLRENNAEIGRRNVTNFNQAKYFHENRVTNRFLRFARNCFEQAPSLKAGAYITYGVQALPAAEIVSRRCGGKVICNAIETPSFRDRALTVNWHPTNLSLLDNAFESYLRKCDKIFTVSWALQKNMDFLGTEVDVVPNYRYREELKKSNKLREMCNLSEGDKLLVTVGHVTTCMEYMLEALKQLPENIHLASFSVISPEDYNEKITNLIKELGLEERVHLFDPVPYAELTTTLSSADAGLIILNMDIVNHKNSLPNRIFDYLASGLPVISPDQIFDCKKIIDEYKVGETIDDEKNPQDWMDAISKTMAIDREEYAKRALKAADELSWESIEDKLEASLDGAKTVTFFGFIDITKNNRTMRMAKTLHDRGIKVTICYPAKKARVKRVDGMTIHQVQNG